MRRSVLSLAFCLWSLLPTPRAQASDPSIAVRGELLPARIGASGTAVLALEIDVPEGWHLYGLDPGEGPQALRIALPDAGPLAGDGPWHGPTPKEAFDRGFGRTLREYEAGLVRFERRVKVAGPPGKAVARVTVTGQICTEERCLTQKREVELGFEIVAGPSAGTGAAPKGAPLSERPRATELLPVIKATGAPSTAPSEGLWKFLLLAFLAGLGALATPCVFPAIPLTVSFFSKFSEESLGRGARLAAFYAFSMIFYFTFAGVVISLVLGATGVRQFAAHPAFNLGLALVLVFFSLNLLGMFEIKTPMFLLELTNRLESKYGPRAGAIGAAVSGRGLGDYVAVAVAAMTATTVFFTCTVAFVGAVVVAAAKGEWFWPTLGMLAFASAFVLPFFLLALFPQAAKRLRGKSGNWLHATRVTLGFIELAASVKFFSNADQVWKMGLLSRDAALTLWVSLFALCGLFLIGKLRFGDAEETHVVSVPRLLLGASTFAFALFLALGLFSSRPLGWVDGWLPPAPAGAEVAFGTKLQWSTDLPAARRKAKETGRLVFVNYTGLTCTNCRYMEASVFPQPGVAALLREMELVELFTDGLTPEDEKNRNDQLERFGTAALPLYVVERDDGTVLATFPSSTNDPEEFRRFLADAAERLRDAAPKPAAQPDAPLASAPLLLKTTRLDDRQPAPAIVPGKWSLVNFWATWCAPCRAELTAFLAQMGQRVAAEGGHFALVAIEDEASLAEARVFTEQLGIPGANALRLPSELSASEVDARFEWNGTVPFTILVSPEGQIAWRQQGSVERARLEAVLTEHLGHAALR